MNGFRLQNFKLAALAFVFLFAFDSLAASAPAAAPHEGGFLFGIGLTGAKGAEQTADGVAVAKRDMIAGEGSLLVGWRIGFVSPVFQADYRIVGQDTPATSVGGSNTAGTAISYGAGLMFSLGAFRLSAIYDVASSYKLSNQNAAGENVSYTGGKGFHASLLYHLHSSFAIGASYMQMNYPTINNGADVNISSNQFNESMYGLTLVYFIF